MEVTSSKSYIEPSSWTVKFIEMNRFYSKSAFDSKNELGFEDFEWKRKFSNFWGSTFALDSVVWVSTEHYYQYAKYYFWGKQIKDFSQARIIYIDNLDKIKRLDVLNKSKIGLSAKILAINFSRENKKLENWNEFNEKWNESNREAELQMNRAITAKFSQNEQLKNLLLRTGQRYLSHYAKFVPVRALTSAKSAYKWGEMTTSLEALKKNPYWTQMTHRLLGGRQSNLDSFRISGATLTGVVNDNGGDSDQGKVLVGNNVMGKILMSVRSDMKTKMNP